MEKIEPMMENASFDILQRQIKCGNNVAQNKISFVVVWEMTSMQDYIMCEVKSEKEPIANVLPGVRFSDITYDRIQCHYFGDK